VHLRRDAEEEDDETAEPDGRVQPGQDRQAASEQKRACSADCQLRHRDALGRRVAGHPLQVLEVRVAGMEEIPAKQHAAEKEEVWHRLFYVRVQGVAGHRPDISAGGQASILLELDERGLRRVAEVAGEHH